MAREDWRDRDRDLERPARNDPRDRYDFGQADYSKDYAYDPQRRAGYRADDDSADYGRPTDRGDYAAREQARSWSDGRVYREEPRSLRDRETYREADADRDPPHREPARSWTERAGEFFSGGPVRSDSPRRRGPSDRVLWAVITERLDDERRLDLRDVEVIVEDAEVTLNGSVRRKEDKRRIEDVADVDGVRHIQNNLRVREGGRWGFR